MRILLFADFALPDSCAGATRVMNIAKILKKLNHQIDVLGISYLQDCSLKGTFDSIDYEMLRAKSWSGFQAYKRIRQLEQQIDLYLKQKSQLTSYDVIILSNVYYDFISVFKKYACNNGTKIAINAVEWYDFGDVQFRGLRGKIKFIKNRIALKKFHVDTSNIIAISDFLNKYYKERGCNTVTIPTIVDLGEYANLKHTNNEKIKIVYAGTPAKKDYIVNFIKAIKYLELDKRKSIEIHLYGIEQDQVVALGVSKDYITDISDVVFCHGRILYSEVKHKIAEADYTILLRPNKRYANAGFPTKVGESMACGTPVIANLTSDLAKYIIDDETGIVSKDETPESCAEAIRRAIESVETISRDAVYDMAVRGFSYDAYVDKMREFLEKCNGK